MSDNTASMARSYRTTIDRARQRHPTFPERIFRYSAANFHHYLATKAYENGHYVNALQWLVQMVRNDRVALLSLWVWGTMLKSVVWIAVLPLSSRMEVDPERWENVKQWVRMPYNKLRDRRLEQSSDIVKPGGLNDPHSTQIIQVEQPARDRKTIQGTLQAAEAQDVGVYCRIKQSILGGHVERSAAESRNLPESSGVDGIGAVSTPSRSIR